MKKLSVVIPIYNEAATITLILQKIGALDLPVVKEVIAVNDGSTDDTQEVLERHRNLVDQLVVIPKNRGKGWAVRMGLGRATGDYAIIQDADLELDPGEYSALLAPLLKGKAQVVYGSRFLKASRSIPWQIRVANRVLTFLTNLLYRSRLTDMETAYKLFDRSIFERIKLDSTGFDFEPEITAKLLRLGYRIHEVPVSYLPRSRASGKKIGWKDGIEAVETLIRCRFSPRGLFSVSGDIERVRPCAVSQE
ncbi:MAG: glycosyltransferase family 2 protein [Candidatus Omnitrophica bacterium]|nr:glycosyltransferase family 2 protein [Candidatus Omnitrophota bacterium]